MNSPYKSTAKCSCRLCTTPNPKGHCGSAKLFMSWIMPSFFETTRFESYPRKTWSTNVTRSNSRTRDAKWRKEDGTSQIFGLSTRGRLRARIGVDIFHVQIGTTSYSTINHGPSELYEWFTSLIWTSWCLYSGRQRSPAFPRDRPKDLWSQDTDMQIAKPWFGSEWNNQAKIPFLKTINGRNPTLYICLQMEWYVSPKIRSCSSDAS